MSTLIKHAGVWKEPEMIYVKDQNIWKEVGGGGGEELSFGVGRFWVPIPTPISRNITFLGRINGYWYVAGNSQIFRSQKGFDWEEVSAPPITIYALAFQDGLWVAAGSAIYTSTNGTSWTLRSSTLTSSRSARGAVKAGGRWVVVGNQRTVLTSSDGITWTQASIPSAFTGDVTGVATRPFDDLIVAISSQGGIVTSQDEGASWISRTSGFGTSHIRSISVVGTGGFVVAGDSGRIETSSNGATWVQRDGGFGSTTVYEVSGSVSPSKNRIIALGEDGNVSLSNAALTSWTHTKTPIEGSAQLTMHIAADGNEIMASRYGQLFLNTLSVMVRI